jgi:N-acetylglucosamine-6-sulfatase
MKCYLSAALALLFGCTSPVTAETDATPAIPTPLTVEATPTPHVVVFMLDDLDVRSFRRLLGGGWLPNVQRYLVDQGVTFENSFSTDAICCPSRTTFFSGQYTHNHGVLDITRGTKYLFPSDATGQGGEASFVPSWLQTRGYRTALFGKYLNGYGGETATAGTRVPPGWNRWLALQGATTYSMYGYGYCNATDTASCVQATGGDAANPAAYQTDWLRDQITAYIAGLNPTTPQFLYLAPTAPHTETNESQPPGLLTYGSVFQWQVPPAPRHQLLIDGITSNGEVPAQDTTIPNYNESDTTYVFKPGWMTQNVPAMNATQQGWAARQYKQRLASMLAIDDMVGAVMGALAAKGMLSSTLVVLTGDNGYFLGEHRLGEKGAPYEEAIRVPLVIRAPGGAHAATTTAIAANHDLAVTIADYSGAVPTRTVDGRSLRPVLQAPASSWSRENLLVEHYQEKGPVVFAAIWPYGTVRTQSVNGNAMYTSYETTQSNVIKAELYDLIADPYQLYNTVSTAAAARLASLQTRLANLRACKGTSCATYENR